LGIHEAQCRFKRPSGGALLTGEVVPPSDARRVPPRFPGALVAASADVVAGEGAQIDHDEDSIQSATHAARNPANVGAGFFAGFASATGSGFVFVFVFVFGRSVMLASLWYRSGSMI